MTLAPDQIVDRVRDRIVSGAIGQGEAVRQDALAAELGISKIPLREALCRLEQDGLIRSIANRGFFAAPMTRADAEEIFALRLKLEPAAAAAAARLASDAERAYAKTCLAALNLATAMRKPGAAAGTANRLFHLALIKPGGRDLTTGIVERLQLLAERYVRKHLEPAGRAARARREHEALLAAWLKRDAARIAKLTRGHITATLRDLKEQLAAAPT
jgi:DNA-binding GntR family transcriptional regulator